MNDIQKGKPISPTSASQNDWTEAKNRRRCDLIDKDIKQALTAEERVELEELQKEVDAHLQRVAPRPIEELEELKSRLEHGVQDAKAS